MRALPRRFRMPRIGIVGLGDVGKRLVRQQLEQPSASSGQLAYRLIGIARRFAPAADDPFLASRDRKARKGLAARNCPILGWDLDRAEDQKRLARVMTHWIVLMPPPDVGSAPGQKMTTDTRSKKLSLQIRLAHARRNPKANGLRARRPSQGVYISTTGVYGDHHGQIVIETSACLAKEHRSLRRVSAEGYWRGLGFSVLRAPGIIAEDRLPIERLKQDSPALRAEDDVWVNHIHAEDLAHLSWLSLFRARPGRVFNAVNQSRLKMADYFDLVAKTKGLRLPRRVSREELQAEIAKGSVSLMMASFMRDSRQIESTRLFTELKAQLLFPTTEEVIHRNKTPITPLSSQSPKAS
ncbi:MAG: hypothetical protein ACO3DL_00580 [Burkholderiaceae bacterium]